MFPMKSDGYTLREADQQDLAECLRRLEFKSVTFETAMVKLARKYADLNPPTSLTAYRKIWKKCLDPSGPRTIGKSVVVDMFIEAVESHPTVNDVEAKKEAQARAVEILRLMMTPIARQVRTLGGKRINLLPANAKGIVLPGVDGISIKAGQKIGCAVGGDHEGCDAETVGIVPCSELGKIHRQFARLDYSEGNWTITCLGKLHPLRVNKRQLPFGQTVPFSHDDIFALRMWHFVVQDPQVLPTT